ncbi:MAG: hypothetical protein LBL21_00240 [Rickettsiales bacterium]|jgi:hypothetical protein|nr:hypothetical protein [Rickettsiales bacterium]
MKKILFYILTTGSAFAVCPGGYTQVSNSSWSFQAAACPNGYTNIDVPAVLPSPTTGGDKRGDFTYGACSYN